MMRRQIQRPASARHRRPGKHAKKNPRKRLYGALAAIALVLIGASMIAYPFVSDYLNRVEQDKVIQSQEQVVAETPAEDLSAYLQAAMDYNARLLAGSTYVIDPFDPTAQTTTNEEYLASLNLNGDGVMGTISIPAIGVNLSISHGTEGEAMNHGVGHVTNTSLPVGGPSTHAVLAGHTGLPSAVIFDKLDKLQVGDYFVIQVLGEEHAYEVYSTEVVLPEETSSLGVSEGEDLITLVTCTPYGVNSHRLLVHARRCEIPQDWLDRKASNSSTSRFVQQITDGGLSPFVIGVLLAVAILLILGIVYLAKRHGRKSREEARDEY